MQDGNELRGSSRARAASERCCPSMWCNVGLPLEVTMDEIPQGTWGYSVLHYLLANIF